MPGEIKSSNGSEGEEIENDQFREKLIFKEYRALLSIIALSLLNGITDTVEMIRTKELGDSPSLAGFSSMCYTLMPIPGIMLMAFLSEFNGRKPILKILILLSIITSIANTSSKPLVIIMGRIIHAVVRGGTLMMTFLAISEYCGPKDRFPYLVANAAIFKIGPMIATLLITKEVFTEDTIYIQLFEIVIGVICFTLPLPESPYWLASKGKYQESKNAFLWLRGKESEEEFRTLMEEDRWPSSLRPFWIVLIPAIATIFVSQCMYWQRIYIAHKVEYINDLMDHHTRTITEISCSIVVLFFIVGVSYQVQRKALYLFVTLIPLFLNYVVAIWLFIENNNFQRSSSLHVMVSILNVLIFCGPYTIGLASFIEIVPYKYNTTLSCICSVFVFASHYFFLKLQFPIGNDFPCHVLILLMSSLAIGGVIVYYVLSPETKQKTLLEIHKLHTREHNVSDSTRDQIVLSNLASLV